jgi:hypothetical protein
MLRRVVLVRTDVSEESNASIIRVTRIGELGTTLVVISTEARCEEMLWLFLQEPHGVISQKTAFLIVTGVKTTNLENFYVQYYEALPEFSLLLISS